MKNSEIRAMAARSVFLRGEAYIGLLIFLRILHITTASTHRAMMIHNSFAEYHRRVLTTIALSDMNIIQEECPETLKVGLK